MTQIYVFIGFLMSNFEVKREKDCIFDRLIGLRKYKYKR